jgi:hypothetical protein
MAGAAFANGFHDQKEVIEKKQAILEIVEKQAPDTCVVKVSTHLTDFPCGKFYDRVQVGTQVIGVATLACTPPRFHGHWCWGEFAPTGYIVPVTP